MGIVGALPSQDLSPSKLSARCSRIKTQEGLSSRSLDSLMRYYYESSSL